MTVGGVYHGGMRSTLAVWLWAACRLSFAQVAEPLWETPFFRFHAPPALAETAGFYGDILERARRRAAEHWSVPLNTPVAVYLWPRESWESLERDQPAMRDVLAFVRGGDQSMVINHFGCRRAGLSELETTLTHEYVHCYLGRALGDWPAGVERRRLPRWLEEGLAMAVANQRGWWDATSLRWLGPRRMIPLMELADDFPAEPSRQRLAYRQSASAVQFLIEENRGLTALIDRVVDPVEGPSFVARAWSPAVVAGLEQRWHATVRLGWRWMLIFTTAGFAWAAVMVVALLAWRRRRELARRRLSRWAMEAEGLIAAGTSDEEQDAEIERLLRGEER